MGLLARLVSCVAAAAALGAVPLDHQRRITRTAGQLSPLPPAAPDRGNWPSFRGPAAAGVMDGLHLPDTWSLETGENILWRIPIAGLAHSSPIVWGDRIFLTTAVSSDAGARFVPGLYGAGTPSEDMTRHQWKVICLDKITGTTIWERVAYEGTPIEKRHIKSTYASATPATDGRIVVAWFGSQGVYAYNLDGSLRWKVDLGHLDVGAYDVPTLEWGTASSPIIWNDLVILQADTHTDDFIVALDAATGEVRWKTERDELPSWGTPNVVPTPRGPQLVTNGSNFIRAYDPRTGKELWRLGRSSQITVPTPIFADGLIVVSSGRGPERPIFVVRPGASGDITLPDGRTSSDVIAWSRTGRGPYMPTPIIYDHVLYVLANNGVFHAYTLATGEQLYETRVPQTTSGFNASPVAADGKIYVSGEDGEFLVIAAGPEFKHLATNEMGEPMMATPALSDDVMYVRTSMSLVAIGRAPAPPSEAERARRGLTQHRPKNFVPWTEGGAPATLGGVTITIEGANAADTRFAGIWRADLANVPNPIAIRIRLDGAGLTGEVSGGASPVKLFDGAIRQGRIEFKFLSPNGDRTISWVGMLKDDQIVFDRTVRVHEGGAPGGLGFFGLRGPSTFVAKRVSK